MKLIIENFGAIKNPIEIIPSELTIFCGTNNTGKTYALYVLNALMDSRLRVAFHKTEEYVNTLLEKGTLEIPLAEFLSNDTLNQAQQDISESLKESLPKFFATNSELVEAARIEVVLDAKEIGDTLKTRNPSVNITSFDFIAGISSSKLTLKYNTDSNTLSFRKDESIDNDKNFLFDINDYLLDIYFINRLGRVFLLPAERTGINLFFRELNSHRANLLRGMTNGLLKDVSISRYPQPIHDYIEFMNSQPEIKRQNFSEFKDIADKLQKEILQVQYKVDSSGDIQISPEGSTADVGLHLGSSTTKTFFGLWSYLTYLARVGDCLMIDEPELNLHPRNQCAIASLLAELVNRGIRVVISTHSDYMVRQWSNLIMLSSDFAGRDALAQQYGLLPNQWLTPDKVVAYEFDSCGAQPMAISKENGISTPLFDESISKINAAAQDIYFARQESAAIAEE